MPLPSREELLKRVRQKSAEQSNSRKDPDEFRVPKATEGKTLEYYFIVLPELQSGDRFKNGVCENGLDNYYYENGFHWFDNQKHECPRIHDGEDCPMCSMGFELMQGSDNKEYKSSISSKYLARGHFAVNVYFINTQKNPEEVRGKVMYFNAPRTVWEKWDACINSDDAGDDMEAKACGIFYHPYEGTYIFKLEVKKKGEWNSYEGSQFIAKSFAPLAVKDNPDGGPKIADEERIEAILAQRLWIPGKFAPRNADRLLKLVEKINAKEQGQDEEEIKEESASTATAVAKPKPSLKPAPKAGAIAPPVKTEVQKQQEFAAAAVTEEVVEETVTEQPTVQEEEVVEDTPVPVQKPAAVVAKPAVPAAKPAVPAAKPVVAAKPAAVIDAAKDPELANLLGAIKSKPKS